MRVIQANEPAGALMAYLNDLSDRVADGSTQPRPSGTVRITGLPSLFVANSTGDYAGVAWVSGFTDIAELERAQNALDESQAFVQLLDSEIPGVYNDQPGAAPRTLYRRIA